MYWPDRFLKNLRFEGDCWISRPYFWWNQKQNWTRNWVWERVHGERQRIEPSCGKTHCVNPDHLRVKVPLSEEEKKRRAVLSSMRSRLTRS